MVNERSDSQRGNPLPPLHGLLFSISSKGSFYMHHPTSFTNPIVYVRTNVRQTDVWMDGLWMHVCIQERKKHHLEEYKYMCLEGI